MSHRIELHQLGAGGFALVALAIGASLFIGPSYVSRGVVKDITTGLIGRQYIADVQCDPEATPPSTLEALNPFRGNRVRVRAFSSDDADAAYREAFPGCKVGFAASEGPPGWMKLLRS